MRSRILIAALVFAGCATPEAKQACFPVASWSSPMLRCAAPEPAPAPEVKPEPEAKAEPEPEAAKPEPEAAKPEAPPTAELSEDTIDSTDTVNFDEDSANLDARSKALVEDVARVMNEHPAIKVQIEGHTDSLAGEKHNMKLAKERIDSVRSYLVEKGVSTKRLTIKVFGEKKPVADNSTEAGRAENRRVVFRVMKAKHGKKKR